MHFGNEALKGASVSPLPPCHRHRIFLLSSHH